MGIGYPIRGGNDNFLILIDKGLDEMIEGALGPSG